MAHRFVFGLLIAAMVSGCAGSGGGMSGSAASVAGATGATTPASSETAVPAPAGAADTPTTSGVPATPVPTAVPTPVSTPVPTPVSTPVSSTAPTITGSPRGSVLAGTAYDFIPGTTNPGGATLVFSIQNAPTWATFNTANGELSGTPTAADVGTSSNITISVSDGTHSAALPSFPIAVTQSANGAATLMWTAPTENTDGTPLTNLAGYRIYYGASQGAMTQSLQLANPGLTTATVSNLSPGTWYFEVRAYTAANLESSASSVGSKTIM